MAIPDPGGPKYSAAELGSDCRVESSVKPTAAAIIRAAMRVLPQIAFSSDRGPEWKRPSHRVGLDLKRFIAVVLRRRLGGSGFWLTQPRLRGLLASHSKPTRSRLERAPEAQRNRRRRSSSHTPLVIDINFADVSPKSWSAGLMPSNFRAALCRNWPAKAAHHRPRRPNRKSHGSEEFSSVTPLPRLHRSWSR